MNDLESDDSKDFKNVSLKDVRYAIYELQIFLKQLPKTPENTLQKLYEIKSCVPYVLDEEIDEIINQIETIESDNLIDQQSDYEKSLSDLIIRLETYIKLTSFQNLWEKIDKGLSRINEMWPPSSFDFRIIQKDLDDNILPVNIVKNIDDSMKAFNEGRFSESISNCGHSAKAIVNSFCIVLNINCEGFNFYAQINGIKKSLESKSIPPAGLEWYVLFLIYVPYWLRNTETHKEESEMRIPQWMNDYRKKQIMREENARVALVCTLQAAKELQKIIEIDEYIKSNN